MKADEIRPGYLYVLKHPPPAAVRADAVGPVVYVPDVRHNGQLSRAWGTPKAAGLGIHGRWMYWTVDGPAEHLDAVQIYAVRAEVVGSDRDAFVTGWYRAVQMTALLDHLAAAGYPAQLDPTGALAIVLDDLSSVRRAVSTLDGVGLAAGRSRDLVAGGFGRRGHRSDRQHVGRCLGEVIGECDTQVVAVAAPRQHP
jgi:hypothetical protein